VSYPIRTDYSATPLRKPYKWESIDDMNRCPFPLKPGAEAVEFECHNYVYLNLSNILLLSITLRSVPLSTCLPVQCLVAVIYTETKKRKHELDILPPIVTRFRMCGGFPTRDLCAFTETRFVSETNLHYVIKHMPKICFYFLTYTFRI
jgi:hypothetical protein